MVFLNLRFLPRCLRITVAKPCAKVRAVLFDPFRFCEFRPSVGLYDLHMLVKQSLLWFLISFPTVDFCLPMVSAMAFCVDPLRMPTSIIFRSSCVRCLCLLLSSIFIRSFPRLPATFSFSLFARFISTRIICTTDFYPNPLGVEVNFSLQRQELYK